MRRVLTLLPILAFAHAVSGAVQLQQVLAGLSSPVLVTNAHDGTNRLFVVEQGGTIEVVQPGSTTPTLFLDITSKVVSGGEQGLLGLAFHPQFPVNPRFYVYYTRAGDGTLVIASYQVPTPASNVADPTETVILTIPHPVNTNHNGGNLAFGPDHFLYMGTGDGGSANDPANNAQNVDALLGKILRIDVDTPNPPANYSSPSDNPFFGATPGADEVWAYGLRNPWRWSFDRGTGVLWVGDVGQSALEEVDTPIVKGGNYGWVVMEGTSCDDPFHTNTCGSNQYIAPVLVYDHSNGRCAITGGFVYRGPGGVFPQGTYLYGDYCSGEIWTYDGSTPTLLMATALNVSSFGEDEAGEVYVVNLGGTVSKFVTAAASCTFTLSPTKATFGSAGGSGSFNVSTQAGCTWTAVSNTTAWLNVTGGASGNGPGVVSYSVAPNTKKGARSGSITAAGRTFTVQQKH